VQAFGGTSASQPGLVAYPNGTLEAFFGAIISNVSSVYGITSSNGGATWSGPTDVRSANNTALAYASDITSALAAGTPILSLPQAGNLVIQRGLGKSAPAYQVTDTNDGATTDANLTVDAATGQAVAGWKSIAHNLVEYMQAVSPGVGALQAVPGQDRNTLILAGRDKGAGVFGAYTPDNTHVRLLRYGGGSVAVGSAHGLTAKVLGVATGLDGRIWIIWGTDSPSGIAVTRSNKAVTRFEPIQRLDPHASGLARVSGDGRLGPLDLLVNELPESKGPVSNGEYYARVLPELSAKVKVTKVKNGKGQVIAHKLVVTVTDAGDPVSGATASAAGKKHKTNKSGKATIVLPGGGGGHVHVSVSDAGYQTLKLRVKL
jgi:hypothetical protein